jgi:hypothetical protein
MEKFGNPVYGWPGGKPKSFCVPCSKKSSAAIIRRRLKRCGAHFSSMKSLLYAVANSIVVENAGQSAIAMAFFHFFGIEEISRICAAKHFGEENEACKAKWCE